MEYVKDLPWLRTATIGAHRVKVLFVGEQCFPVRMLLALDGEAVVYMAVVLEQIHQWYPHLLTFATVHVRLGISDHDQGISSSR
jgi:hypothetical protein